MKKLDIQFTEDQRDNLVIDILTDAIMYEQVIKAVDQLARVYNPNSESGNWDGDLQFSGITKAFPLMGFQDSLTISEEKVKLPIIYTLGNIYSAYLKKNDSKKEGEKFNAKTMAKHILIDWKEYLYISEMSEF